MEFVFYYDAVTYQDITPQAYEKLLKKLGPEKTSKLVETITVPLQSVRVEDA